MSPAHLEFSSSRCCQSINYVRSNLSNVRPKGRFERTYVLWIKKNYFQHWTGIPGSQDMRPNHWATLPPSSKEWTSIVRFTAWTLVHMTANFDFQVQHRKQGLVAQWWEHSHPTKVAQVRLLDLASDVNWIAWFSTCRTLLWEVYLQVLWFSPLFKNQRYNWYELIRFYFCTLSPFSTQVSVKCIWQSKNKLH